MVSAALPSPDAKNFQKFYAFECGPSIAERAVALCWRRFEIRHRLVGCLRQGATRLTGG